MVRILKLWLSHLFSREIIQIIKGNINRLLRRRTGLYSKRYFECSKCEHREDYPVVGEICGLCGCPLESKLRVEDEHCEIDKW